MKLIANQVSAIVLAPITHAGVKYAPGSEPVSLPKHDFDYLFKLGKVKAHDPAAGEPAASETEAVAEVVHNPDESGQRLKEMQTQSPETDPDEGKAPARGTMFGRKARHRK